MKKILTLLLFFCLILSCDDPAECLKKTGTMISREIPVTAFDKIIVHRGIALVITKGEEYRVSVVAGENLIDDIRVKITNGVLDLRDETTCNWVRDYGATTIYVTTPTLTQVESKTEQNITCGNVLEFADLKLISLDLAGGAGTGDFILEVNCNGLDISSNNVSGFYISGFANNFVAGFFEGNGILKAYGLQANSVYVFHRGSNDLYISPSNDISGHIYSTGNVFCNNVPPVVNVERHYQGRLIFE